MYRKYFGVGLTAWGKVKIQLLVFICQCRRHYQNELLVISQIIPVCLCLELEMPEGTRNTRWAALAQIDGPKWMPGDRTRGSHN